LTVDEWNSRVVAFLWGCLAILVLLSLLLVVTT
jgi:hypothetical protein